MFYAVELNYAARLEANIDVEVIVDKAAYM
jgi:hypothetical protein